MALELEDPAVTELLGLVAGRYAVHSVLGSGGDSVVYRAHDRILDRSVALKVMRRPERSIGARRLHDEARLTASFDHEAIVRTLDAGFITAPNGYRASFLVMELVEGPDLREMLRHGAMSPQAARKACSAVATALAYVHERGVIHNDVKPQNILVPGLDLGRARLTDFGIALRTDHPLRDAAGSTLGTAAYLSPERLRGDAVDTASDIYALGLTLIECITGRVAFPGGVVESAEARLRRPPPIPEAVPSEIAGVIRLMTAMRPNVRPTASALVPLLRQSGTGTIGRHALRV